jgi:hypothetical protein
MFYHRSGRSPAGGAVMPWPAIPSLAHSPASCPGDGAAWRQHADRVQRGDDVTGPPPTKARKTLSVLARAERVILVQASGGVVDDGQQASIVFPGGDLPDSLEDNTGGDARSRLREQRLRSRGGGIPEHGADQVHRVVQVGRAGDGEDPGWCRRRLAGEPVPVDGVLVTVRRSGVQDFQFLAAVLIGDHRHGQVRVGSEFGG